MRAAGVSDPGDHRLRVILYEPAGRGGVCHYTYELGEHLAGAGVDVTLLTTEDYELKHLAHHFRIDYLFTTSWITRLRQRFANRRRRGVASSGHAASGKPRNVRSPFLRRTRIRFRHLRALFAFLRRRPDVVHFQWLVNRSLDVQFIRWLGRVGIPTVYTAHDVEPHRTSPEARIELQKLYDSVAKIIVHAESNKRELLSLFDVDASKVAVIPHGSYEFLVSPEARDVAREKIGIPRSRRVVLFFGLIKRYKGLEYLVDAFQQVRDRIDDAFLLIVGDVYAGDPEGHRYYTGMIESLRSREDVAVVASYVPLEAVGNYLAAADVVVLPYTRTYQSGVLLAAYAAGRPVVVTDTGGLGEVVEAGKSGFVVPPKDVKALAKALIEILTDDDRRIAMGKHARVLATSVYAWDGVASKTIAIYRSVAEGARQPLRNGPSSALDSNFGGFL